MFLIQKGQIKVTTSLFFGLKLVEYSKKKPPPTAIFQQTQIFKNYRLFSITSAPNQGVS